jgi:DNA excision repair protein ERCC-2
VREKPVITVSVRDFVEFALRTGDLGGDGDFIGPARVLEGIRGHQRIQRSRPEGYQAEVPLAFEVDGGDFVLRFQGRLDGLMPGAASPVVEEIKTVRPPWDGVADPLHWAQGKVYAHILAAQRNLPAVTVQLTYLELETNRLAELREEFTAAALAEFFRAALAVQLEWTRRQVEWWRARDAAIAAAPFPFAHYRAGQRELSVAVYRALARGGRLFAEAPTGIGKTVSVLFPAAKALGEGKFEKLFYLTARTPGRAAAEKALEDLRAGGLRLRSVTLTARDKICFNDGRPCDMAACPFARGYYDRIKPAMLDALRFEALTRPRIEEIARRHQVCPFELSLDVSRWCDAVIGDYNHLFDPQARLRRYFEEGGDYAFLVDEAHNLVERAREMFSADLTTAELSDTARAINGALPRCANLLRRAAGAMRNGEAGSAAADEGGVHPELNFAGTDSAAPPATGEAPAPRAPDDVPAMFLRLLRDFLGAAEAWLARNEPAEFREAMLQLYFRAAAFLRVAEALDERFVVLRERIGEDTRVKLFCRDPARSLRQALDGGSAAVFFSATFSPLEFFRELLGGDETDPILQLPSPFPPGNLRVLLHDRIGTDFKSRGHTFEAVAGAIAALVEARRGNYLVYFPSYRYLAEVLARFRALRPALRVVAQEPGMDEPAREAFLAAFRAEAADTVTGFAVMGGIFGEGIDLVGERLIGAVVVGVGLPQIGPERDAIRDYFETTRGAGFDYAYVFPGMNRVLQAAGRVIRSETDRGIVLLIDERFGRARHRRLLPAWWQPVVVRSAEAVAAAAAKFWGETPAGIPAEATRGRSEA